MKHIGFRLTGVRPGYAEGRMRVKKHLLQQDGFLHGGVTSTLCDIVAGFASFTMAPAGHYVFTAEMKVSYLNPGTGGEIIAKGWVLKAGERLHFCESELWEKKAGKKKLIARASATMAVVDRLKPGKALKQRR